MILWLWWALTAWSATPHTDQRAFASWLDQTHDALAEASAWRSPTRSEREAVAVLVGGIAREISRCDPAAVDTLARDAARADWLLDAHTVGDQTYLVLREREPHGGGLFTWRCGPEGSVVVQAPHAFFDLRTDVIARHAVRASTVRAAWWSTVHRYRATPDEPRHAPVHPADVTRQTTSVFHTVALAWTAARPSDRVIQLHGFGADRVDGDVVVSSGDADRPPRAQASLLQAQLGLTSERVFVFGVDTTRLGGSQNVLSQRMLEAPTARFLHLELAKPIRERLADDVEATVRLVDALGASPWGF